MKILNDIEYILHNNFKCKKNYFEEEDAKMLLPIKPEGCQFILYKFDKNLGKEYKGGLFPFFAKNKDVCKISDYILFAEKGGTLYILVIEMKRGNEQTLPQLKAALAFTKYIVETVNRVKGANYKPEIRLISIHNYKIRKKKTKENGVKYNKFNHCDVTSANFNVKLYLV